MASTRSASGDLRRIRTSVTTVTPRLSWIVAPEAYTEHPAWPAGYGAWYTARVLNSLTSDPEVWSKTALLITFDENDGFFDHVVGPYPNVGKLAGHSTVPLDSELFQGKAGTPGGSDGVVGPYEPSAAI
jgi:phospholipase C